MHILFLTDNFPPEVNAPASRTFEHCREWVKAGHRVTVITCAPNFPKGKVFDGYRNKPWQTEAPSPSRFRHLPGRAIRRDTGRRPAADATRGRLFSSPKHAA